MTRHLHPAERRALNALLAAAEIEALSGAPPAADSEVALELRAAGRGLRQAVAAQGRRA